MRKAYFVVSVHRTDASQEMTYISFVSRDTARILLTITVLGDLVLRFFDFGN